MTTDRCRSFQIAFPNSFNFFSFWILRKLSCGRGVGGAEHTAGNGAATAHASPPSSGEDTADPDASLLPSRRSRSADSSVAGPGPQRVRCPNQRLPPPPPGPTKPETECGSTNSWENVAFGARVIECGCFRLTRPAGKKLADRKKCHFPCPTPTKATTHSTIIPKLPVEKDGGLGEMPFGIYSWKTLLKLNPSQKNDCFDLMRPGEMINQGVAFSNSQPGGDQGGSRLGLQLWICKTGQALAPKVRVRGLAGDLLLIA